LTSLGGLAADGSQTGKGLSASRIDQTHQLVGAVLKYAHWTGKIAKNVALEMSRTQDLPQPTERERRYLSHAELRGWRRPPDDSRRLPSYSATAARGSMKRLHCVVAVWGSGS
jgi:hypothetical protein